jgi:hypothetical protein
MTAFVLIMKLLNAYILWFWAHLLIPTRYKNLAGNETRLSLLALYEELKHAVPSFAQKGIQLYATQKLHINQIIIYERFNYKRKSIQSSHR